MSLIDVLCRTSDALFGERWSEKLKMAANVLLHEWHMFQSGSEWAASFLNVTDQEINETFKDLDAESREHILRNVAFKRDFAVVGKKPEWYFYNYSKFYRKEELKRIPHVHAVLRRERWKYRSVRHVVLGYSESLVYHHGLVYCPEAVKAYLRGGVFLDVGACYGDSTLVFARHYHPGKIFAFEPSGLNRDILHAIMEKNGIAPSLYEVVPLGLGREAKSVIYHEEQGAGNSLSNNEGGTTRLDIVACDVFCAERNLTAIKLIKADVEGMGLEMLLGAERVIRENRPVLSLSIYHNRDELFGIYRTLQDWNLDYRYIARMLAFPINFGELSLLVWPRELER